MTALGVLLPPYTQIQYDGSSNVYTENRGRREGRNDRHAAIMLPLSDHLGLTFTCYPSPPSLQQILAIRCGLHVQAGVCLLSGVCMECQGRQCGVTAPSDQPSWWSTGAPISVSVLGHNKPYTGCHWRRRVCPDRTLPLPSLPGTIAPPTNLSPPYQGQCPQPSAYPLPASYYAPSHQQWQAMESLLPPAYPMHSQHC